jgi:uncharacterized protein YuzE
MTLQAISHGALRGEYDPDADALYVYLSDRPYSHGRDLDDARRIDYAADGVPVGIEILSPRVAGVDVAGLPDGDAVAAIAGKLGLPVKQQVS